MRNQKSAQFNHRLGLSGELKGGTRACIHTRDYVPQHSGNTAERLPRHDVLGSNRALAAARHVELGVTIGSGCRSGEIVLRKLDQLPYCCAIAFTTDLIGQSSQLSIHANNVNVDAEMPLPGHGA